MAFMRFRQFLGEQPARHPNQLGENQAQVARNTRIVRQALETFWGLRKERDTDLSESPRTISRDRQGNWLEWDELTWAVNSVVPGDEYDRLFFVNESAGVRVSDATRRLSGDGPFPGASLRLGVPTPDESSATVEGSGDEEDDDGNPNDRVSVAYLVTLVNEYGEEGPPSRATGVVDVYPNYEVEINFPDVPEGDYELAYWRVYRNTEGEWLFLKEVDVNNTSTTDDDIDPALEGEPLESQNWDEPPDDLKGLIAVNGNYLAGYRENEVLFSEYQLPHAWPFANRQAIDYTVKALGSFGNTVVVMTNGPVYMAQGATPSGLAVVETGLQQACVSEESVVSFAGSVVFASSDGLVRVASSDSGIASMRTFTPREWGEINPSSIRAAQWRGMYFASYKNDDGAGAFLFDPVNPEAGVIWLDMDRAAAVYNDVENDELFLVFDGETEIREWDADSDSSFDSARWRSRPVEIPNRPAINLVRVRSDDYPITVRLYADGSEQAAVDVEDDRPRRISGAKRALRYEVEVETEYPVYEIAFASTMAEMRKE